MTAGPSRSITVAQVVAILASTAVLFFLIAFATKTLDAHRLRVWRDRLQSEIAVMEQERQALAAELARRRSPAWLEEALRDAGLVGEKMVGVVLVTTTPPPQVGATPAPVATPLPATATQGTLFANPHWRAWMQLLWGRPKDAPAP